MNTETSHPSAAAGHLSTGRRSFGRMLIACLLTALPVLFWNPSTLAQAAQIYRDRVEPHWFNNGDQFWYRIELPDNGHEFVLVDARHGRRKLAFDHESVAGQIAEILGRPIDAHKLPFDRLQFDDDGSTIRAFGGAGVWTIQRSTNEVKLDKAATVQNSATRFFLPPRRSHDRGRDTELELVNQLDLPIRLIWVTRDNRRQSYGTIAAGARKRQHTFVGHVWILQTEDGKDQAAFEATPGNNSIVITKAAMDQVQQQNRTPRQRKRIQAPPAEIRSPDRQHAVFERGHQLWLAQHDANGTLTNERVIAADGGAENSFRRDVSRSRLVEMQYDRDDLQAGAADIQWAPNNQFFVAFQTQPTAERRVYYVESSPRDQLQPKLQSYPYAKPGDPLPKRTPRLFQVDGTEIEVAQDLFPNPFKLRFLKWSDDGSRFWLLYNERGHQTLRVLEVQAASGTVRSIVEERSETFIHYSTSGKFELQWLPQQLLWASERSGWNHLYRYDLNDARVLNAVTAGPWNVRRIEHIDRSKKVIWFYAVGILPDQDPYHEHFCRINFDGSGLQILTAGDGTHEVEFSPDRRYLIDRYSRVDLPPITELRDAEDGRLMTSLETADASQLIAARPLPIRFHAKGRDGKTDIWGMIHLPLNFDEQQSYPVVENIYAGPHDHHVPKAFRSRYRHQHQIADRGIIVVQIDGMGTAWRSKAFHDVCYRNLKDAGFPDRIAWIRAAARKYPAMDVSRVGIYGGSAGGQNAMAALLWHGTFYKAAVADCGCHDNRMDKLWWNEQWMGYPVGEHYVASSNMENAYRLQGKLMLVVGELDRNVDPASTTQVVKKLMDADKDFEFLLVAGAGHGACERPYASRRRADFLAKHLRAGTDQDSNGL